MKKLLVIILLVVLSGLSLTFLIIPATDLPKLYVLNWDEYISEDLIMKFEEEYDCKVVLEIAESNEIMYSRIKTNSADYDIAIPSDYMIGQMAQDGLIQKLDFKQIPNYDFEDEEFIVPTLKAIIDSTELNEYLVPYFWGSLGIMYNTDIISEEEFEAEANKYLEEGKSVWNILFDKKYENMIGMYATSRDSIAAALMALGYSLNTINEAELTEAGKMLQQMNYKGWATDDLKVGVAGGKYGMALVYSGDYIDALYSLDDASEANFKMYCPKEANNVFFDAMVIPTTSQNTELAHQFINFMIDNEVTEEEYKEYEKELEEYETLSEKEKKGAEEPSEPLSNAYTNADAVGYCPALSAVLADFLDCVEQYPIDLADYEALSEAEKAETEEPDPADYYIGICDQDAYNPSDIENGEVYKYLGQDIYNTYERLYKNAKSNIDEEDTNVSAYILIGIVAALVLGLTAAAIISKKKKKY